MLKNSRTLAVSVAINISMKLCFISVNGPRESYFVDDPRKYAIRICFKSCVFINCKNASKIGFLNMAGVIKFASVGSFEFIEEFLF
jgi:hypothetical protein